MGRMNSYPADNNPGFNDILLIDGNSGTRKVSINALANSLPGRGHGINRSGWFRGLNLGSTFTDAQKSAIKNGSFEGMYTGDYWLIDGITWRIVDFDYWYVAGDVERIQHHVVIMPDSRLYTYKMNDTNTTDGGYMGSKMYTEGLNQAKNKINDIFGSAYIYNHREYLTNAVTNGAASGGIWTDSTVEIPNEPMIYGCHFYTTMNDGNKNLNQLTIDNTQLSLFRITRLYIARRQSYWLRDVASNVRFTCMNYQGRAGWDLASVESGVRPVFGLTGG